MKKNRRVSEDEPENFSEDFSEYIRQNDNHNVTINLIVAADTVGHSVTDGSKKSPQKLATQVDS